MTDDDCNYLRISDTNLRRYLQYGHGGEGLKGLGVEGFGRIGGVRGFGRVW